MTRRTAGRRGKGEEPLRKALRERHPLALLLLTPALRQTPNPHRPVVRRRRKHSRVLGVPRDGVDSSWTVAREDEDECGRVAVPDVYLTVCEGSGVSEDERDGEDKLTFAPAEDVVLERTTEAALQDILPLIVPLVPPQDRPVP